MTRADAIERVEALFAHVHETVGFPTPYENQAGRTVGDGPRDMTCAPNGEPYDTVTSFGFNEHASDAPVLFRSEGLAMEWWFDEVREFQKSTEATHLYWCQQPEFVSTTFIIMDQGGVMRTQSPLAEVPQVDLGFVTAKLLVSKRGLDGKED